MHFVRNSLLYRPSKVRRDSSVGMATRYGLDGPGIKSRCGAPGFLLVPASVAAFVIRNAKNNYL